MGVHDLKARCRGFAAFLGALALALAHSTASHASPPGHDDRVPNFVVLGGGIALGSYQAGYMWQLARELKKMRDTDKLVMTAGASAGALSSALFIRQYCSEDDSDNLQTSEIVRSWIEIGWDKLLPGKDCVKSDSLFCSNELAAKVDTVLRGKIRAYKDCHVIMVISAVVDDDNGNPGAAPWQSDLQHYFALDFSFDDSGAPRFRNAAGVAPEPTEGERAYLVTSDEGEIDIEDVGALLRASSAFPLAFPSVPVPVCTSPKIQASEDHKKEWITCAGRATRRYRDGGVFDNIPLWVAGKFYLDQYLREKKQDQPAIPTPKFHVISLSNPAVKPRKMEAEKAKPRGPETQDEPRNIIESLSGWVAYARGRRFNNALKMVKDNIGDPKRIVTEAEQSVTPLSAHLGAFMGFLSKGMRTLDAELGANDAWKHYKLSDLSPKTSCIGAIAHYQEETGPKKTELRKPPSLPEDACPKDVFSETDATYLAAALRGDLAAWGEGWCRNHETDKDCIERVRATTHLCNFVSGIPEAGLPGTVLCAPPADCSSGYDGFFESRTAAVLATPSAAAKNELMQGNLVDLRGDYATRGLYQDEADDLAVVTQAVKGLADDWAAARQRALDNKERPGKGEDCFARLRAAPLKVGAEALVAEAVSPIDSFHAFLVYGGDGEVELGIGLPLRLFPKNLRWEAFYRHAITNNAPDINGAGLRMQLLARPANSLELGIGFDYATSQTTGTEHWKKDFRIVPELSVADRIRIDAPLRLWDNGKWDPSFTVRVGFLFF